MIGQAPIWLWVFFHLLLLALLALDLALTYHARAKDAQEHAIGSTLVWIGSALLFSLLVGHAMGVPSAVKYLTAYGIEGSLSADNLLVFLVVFRSFGLVAEQQRRVLFWGVLGAVLMRACMIAAGLTLLRLFSWASELFAIVLFLAAIHLLRQKTGAPDAPLPRWTSALSRYFPLSDAPPTKHFFVWERRRLLGTQLLLALVTIEITDLLFAVDSVPAVLAVTSHPFLVWSSNIFAVMGLRSLYFVLAGLLQRLRLLHYGLAVVLVFVGAKLLLARVVEVPVVVSLAVLVGAVGVTALLSLYWRPMAREN
jgi:tellurite resistance protein TerC